MPDLSGDRDEEREELEAQDDGPFGDWEPSPMPIAPDGGIMPGYALDQPAPPPPMDAEHSPCVRGPCRHLWELQTSVNAGNPAGTPGIEDLRHYFRSCMFGGQEMELKDSTVLECSNWDPMDSSVFREREYRRKKWLEEFQSDVIDTEETDEASKE